MWPSRTAAFRQQAGVTDLPCDHHAPPLLNSRTRLPMRVDQCLHVSQAHTSWGLCRGEAWAITHSIHVHIGRNAMPHTQTAHAHTQLHTHHAPHTAAHTPCPTHRRTCTHTPKHTLWGPWGDGAWAHHGARSCAGGGPVAGSPLPLPRRAGWRPQRRSLGEGRAPPAHV